MNKSILEVKNISKSYRTYSSELMRILSWFGFKRKIVEETYTLQNINFSISSGEAILIAIIHSLICRKQSKSFSHANRFPSL